MFKKLNAWLYSADRSGPSGDGNQTCGVVIHREFLFGGEHVSLFSWVSMCYTLTLIRCGELKRLNKVPRIVIRKNYQRGAVIQKAS